MDKFKLLTENFEKYSALLGKEASFRLCHGELAGMESLYIDYLAGIFVVEIKEEIHAETLEELYSFFKNSLKAKAIYLLDRKNKGQYLKYKKLFVEDEARPQRVLENGLKYNVFFDRGFHYGLFLDQRMNRDFILQKIKAQSCLNLFAYTCAFSVLAASLGARCTSVDMSQAYLNKGKENFALNSLDPTKHSFFKDDVRDFLKRAQKKKRLYDLIVCDPPTFAHGPKKSFKFTNEASDLLLKCFSLLNEGAFMLFSHNCQSFEEFDLLAWLPEDEYRLHDFCYPSDFGGEESIDRISQGFWLEKIKHST